MTENEKRTRIQRHVLQVQMTVRDLVAADAKLSGQAFLPTPTVTRFVR